MPGLNLIPGTGEGGGTVDPEQVADLVAAEVAAALPADRLLPPDGEPEMMLLRNDNDAEIIAKWVDQPAMNKYRGIWAPDELVALYDFGEGTFSPWTYYNPDILQGSLGSSPGPYLTGVSQYSNADQPAWQTAVRLTVNTSTVGMRRGIQLDPSVIPDLNDRVLTRVVFHAAPYGGSTARVVLDTLENAVVRNTITYPPNGSGSQPWVEHEISLTGAGSLIFRVRNIQSASTDNYWLLAGIRLFGTARPYMYGDVVDHAGTFWRSIVNNNSSTPGESSTWEAITP